MKHLPLMLEGSARAWLTQLAPGTLHSSEALSRVFVRPSEGTCKRPAGVTSQIFNLECYTLDHHRISYFIAFWLDPRKFYATQGPTKRVGDFIIIIFEFSQILKKDRLILIIFSSNISFMKIKERG